jgi:hypothetical protein
VGEHHEKSPMTARVKLNELRQAIDRVFDHLAEHGYREIELDADYYWVIHRASDKYDPYSEPKNLSLGSLYDDWQRVEELAVGEAEPIARDLIQLAALLSYVGERLQSSC